MKQPHHSPASILGLTAHWRRRAAWVRAHWRGELTVWQSLGNGGFLLAIFALLLGLMVSMAVTVQDFPFSVVVAVPSLLALPALLWWFKGLFALSNRLLESNRLVAGLWVFVLAFAGGLWSCLELAPTLADQGFRAVTEDLKMYREEQRCNARFQYFYGIPTTVLAQPELQRIVFHGPVNEGSAKQLADAMAAHPGLTLLELDSPGGWVSEMNTMVALLQEHPMDTLVLDGCASACTAVFLAGQRRYVGPDAQLGFHQAGYCGRPDETTWGTTEYENAILYRARGVAQPFADQALNTSYYDMLFVDALAAKQAGVATHWWSDRPAQYQ